MVNDLVPRRYAYVLMSISAQEISKKGEKLAQDEPYILNNGKHSEVVIHTAEHVREFLRQDTNDHWHAEDLNFGDYFNRILGQCAGALYNQEWRTVRRYFDPAYTHGTSVSMIPVFQAEVSQWLKGLKNDALSSGVGRVVFNVQQACKVIPLRAIPLSIYGDAYTEQEQLTIPAQHVFKGVDIEGGMTMDQYLQTIDEMIFTNIGITGSILAFMLEQLALHPAFQQDLHTEIISRKAAADLRLDAYVGSSSTLLHYLCMEVVRLHPALGELPSPHSTPYNAMS
ncbi:hypothetical protein N0V95_005407 [Ascochyta clinopodiicola]|nr:hypothetical protein N0V95_005407 [Ascochyta clinopodiicola]